MKLKFLTLILLWACFIAVPTKTEAALTQLLIYADDGTTYNIVWTTGTATSITQLGSNTVGLVAIGDSSGGFLTEYIVSPGGELAPNFQSAIISSIPLVSAIDRFDPTGSGTVSFQNGTDLSLSDLLASPFLGQLAIQDPNPATFFPGFSPSSDYPVYGFNLAPGESPTVHIPYLSAAPSDGFILLPGQSIVFAWLPHPNQPLAVGVGGFDLNGEFLAINSGGIVNTLPPRGSVVPEPVSLLLLGSGLFGVMGTLRRRK